MKLKILLTEVLLSMEITELGRILACGFATMMKFMISTKVSLNTMAGPFAGGGLSLASSSL